MGNRSAAPSHYRRMGKKREDIMIAEPSQVEDSYTKAGLSVPGRFLLLA